jgi:hypothetical protein
MKTIIVMVCSGLLFLGTLTSCKSGCTVCEKGSAADVRICKDDYSNDEQYRQAIQEKEADDYSCHN